MGNIAVVKPLFYPILRVNPSSNLPHTGTIAIDPDDMSQLQIVKDNFTLSWMEITYKTIEKPLEKILEAFNMNLSDIKTGTSQSDLFSF